MGSALKAGRYPIHFGAELKLNRRGTNWDSSGSSAQSIGIEIRKQKRRAVTPSRLCSHGEFVNDFLKNQALSEPNCRICTNVRSTP